MNDKTVCGTAPATPNLFMTIGVLFNVKMSKILHAHISSSHSLIIIAKIIVWGWNITQHQKIKNLHTGVQSMNHCSLSANIGPAYRRLLKLYIKDYIKLFI